METGGEERRCEILTSEWGRTLLRWSPSAQLCDFLQRCSGEGMKIVGFILEWGLLQTQGETGKEVEGTCEEVLIVRSRSAWSGQGLTLLPTFMYLTSPCHLAPLKTGSSPRNLRNVLSWPHSRPCPASTLSLASPSQPDFSKGLSIP